MLGAVRETVRPDADLHRRDGLLAVRGEDAHPVLAAIGK
jgi:hypothetical protein